MSYKLSYVAPGSYDVLLNGVIIASAVRVGSPDAPTWTVEVLDDLPLEPRPAPFTELEHRFGTLDAARQWLGVPLSGAGIIGEARGRR